MILNAVPDPTSPQWKTLSSFPMYFRKFFACSNSDFSFAPTMNVNVPSSAPMGPPDTGASTNVKEPNEGVDEDTADATSRMVPVSMVPHSMRILFWGVEEELAVERAPDMRPVVGSR